MIRFPLISSHYLYNKEPDAISAGAGLSLTESSQSTKFDPYHGIDIKNSRLVIFQIGHQDRKSMAEIDGEWTRGGSSLNLLAFGKEQEKPIFNPGTQATIGTLYHNLSADDLSISPRAFALLHDQTNKKIYAMQMNRQLFFISSIFDKSKKTFVPFNIHNAFSPFSSLSPREVHFPIRVTIGNTTLEIETVDFNSGHPRFEEITDIAQREEQYMQAQEKLRRETFELSYPMTVFETERKTRSSRYSSKRSSQPTTIQIQGREWIDPQIVARRAIDIKKHLREQQVPPDKSIMRFAYIGSDGKTYLKLDQSESIPLSKILMPKNEVMVMDIPAEGLRVQLLPFIAPLYFSGIMGQRPFDLADTRFYSLSQLNALEHPFDDDNHVIWPISPQRVSKLSQKPIYRQAFDAIERQVLNGRVLFSVHPDGDLIVTYPERNQSMYPIRPNKVEIVKVGKSIRLPLGKTMKPRDPDAQEQETSFQQYYLDIEYSHSLQVKLQLNSQLEEPNERQSTPLTFNRTVTRNADSEMSQQELHNNDLADFIDMTDL